jgi:hypothetical protein
MTPSTKSTVRALAVATTIGSFALAALLGVAALLLSADFGETEIRILLTTVVVGSASVLTLCCLSVVGTRYIWVAAAGGVAILAATATALLLTWTTGLGDGLVRTFGVATVAALTLAQTCLLLAVAAARRRIAWLLWSTVALAVVLAGLVSALILGADSGDGTARLLGVVGILDVLGTVVTIALGAFGADARSLTVSLPAPIAARLRKQSSDTGRPVRDLVDEALARYYGMNQTDDAARQVDRRR